MFQFESLAITLIRKVKAENELPTIKIFYSPLIFTEKNKYLKFIKKIIRVRWINFETGKLEDQM